MGKKLLLGILAIAILAFAIYFLFVPKPEPPITTVPSDATDCGNDLDCLKQAAQEGEKAMAFVEVEPSPYSWAELREFERQGIEPPEKTGSLFSHLVKSCENGICSVAIKLERFPSDIPEPIKAVVGGMTDMVCQVPVDMVGEIPDDISNCSGPMVDAVGLVEEKFVGPRS